MEFTRAEHEAARLSVLKSFAILDSPAEQAFDDLVRLTSEVCGTPMALIGFMDTGRFWLKARIGLHIKELPRDMSFCAHTILQSDVLVVPDTLADQGRMAECALAAYGGVRFYAGASLLSSEGHALGTVCAMDKIPRGLSQAQTETLRTIARLVVHLLETRRMALHSLVTTNSGHPIDRHETPKVLGFSFWKEIAEQRKWRDALRQNEQRLQGIIATAMDAIVTVDGNQRILVFNQAAEQIFRCTASQAVGQSLDRFIPERFRAGHQAHVREFATAGTTTRSMGAPARLFGIRYDGEEFPIEATISKADIDGLPLCTVILRDASARLRLEAELRQAQRLEAVEQLAGGMAHQFNSYLGVILGYSDLLAEEAGLNERLCRYVAQIGLATQHAASLTRQLLAFGRKHVPVVRALNLSEWIGENQHLLRQLVPADVEVVLDLPPKVGCIRADPAQIQQVLANLLLNARDAMPEGGRVVIATADVDVEANASEGGDVRPGRCVSLTVSDTGRGMSAKTREHLFEPFYTTKEPGRGAGLGLAAVFGIVKDCGGHITVESSQGGTTFRICLPRAPEAPEELTVSVLRPLGQNRTATILVVEDDAALRRLLCLSLEKGSHKVLAATDGVEAVEIFREHATEIQLVITDLVMPRMNGLELKQEIAAMAPGVRFLFMSGLAEQVVSRQWGSFAGCDFLEKPFRLGELAKKVAVVLEREAA